LRQKSYIGPNFTIRTDTRDLVEVL
jgi:hypothetical protein